MTQDAEAMLPWIRFIVWCEERIDRDLSMDSSEPYRLLQRAAVDIALQNFTAHLRAPR